MSGLAQITEASELTLPERSAVIALLKSSSTTQLVDYILGRRAQTLSGMVIDLGIGNCEDGGGELDGGAAGGGRRRRKVRRQILLGISITLTIIYTLIIWSLPSALLLCKYLGVLSSLANQCLPEIVSKRH